MKRRALFVGVDRYEDGAFRDLRYSVADAAALAAAFGRHGFETHVATNPGASELLKEVKLRTAGLGAGDVFLLDACRTDVFAGKETRGAATRDLGLVALPDAKKHPGTCCVVRSCDRFCPALEYADLGHGVFTRAMLDLLEGPEGRTLRMGEEFVGGLRRRMDALLHDGDVQNPHCDSNGASFGLFAEGTGGDGASPAGDVAALRAEMERMRAEMARLAALAAGRKAEGAAPAPAPPGAAGRKAGETTTITLPGGAEMEMAWCPPGSFTMGSPATEEGRFGDETQHRVTLTKGFWMAKTPVTQRQWKSVMGNNPSCFEGDDLPVECVSWFDAQEFCRKAGLGLALPTEAQWEYACRAGTTGPYAGTGRLEDMGWYRGNSGRQTHPVGQKQPNAWGLCDMHGNVWEWCADWYGDYPCGGVTDPKGASSGSYRVLRGGSWGYIAAYCRSAHRYYDYYPSSSSRHLGFRLSRILS